MSDEQRNRLVSFLFVLMRDHLPFGSVAGIISNHVNKADGKEPVADDAATSLLLAASNEMAIELMGDK